MSFHCIVGGSRDARVAAAGAHLSGLATAVRPTLASSDWPFTRHILPDIDGTAPAAILIADLHLAFPIGQTAGTRLVLTQSTYQLQRWLDRFDTRAVTIVAHASRSGLTGGAPDAFAQRGPWSRITIEELPGDDEGVLPADGDRLSSVFSAAVGERLDVFRQTLARQPDNAALHLGLASTLMELDDLRPAQDALDRATTLAPDWEAVWFEYGKLWLRADDLERAAERFAEAARLMPSFSAALSNLGAALAEIDRPDEAMTALEQALRVDPRGYPILNNLAVIYREQGRLDEAVEAGRRVIALAPTFVFGHYNLAHALFLSGRFAESRDVYADGQERDAQKNPVQAARLAVVRAATGDGARAAVELRRVLERVPADVRERIVEETSATLEALVTLPQVSLAAIDEVAVVVRRG